VGSERQSHVLNLVGDEGLAVFAGWNVLPKRSDLAAYRSRIGHWDGGRWLDTGCQPVPPIGLERSGSRDLDVPTGPA
jgi:hypothetical protein